MYSKSFASKEYLRGLEPQLIKLEFIIYLPKLKVLLIIQYPITVRS